MRPAACRRAAHTSGSQSPRAVSSCKGTPCSAPRGRSELILPEGRDLRALPFQQQCGWKTQRRAPGSYLCHVGAALSWTLRYPLQQKKTGLCYQAHRVIGLEGTGRTQVRGPHVLRGAVPVPGQLAVCLQGPGPAPAWPRGSWLLLAGINMALVSPATKRRSSCRYMSTATCKKASSPTRASSSKYGRRLQTKPSHR